MADEKNNNGDVGTNSFDKSLSTDVRDYHSSRRSWSFARNAITTSPTGDLGDLGNEISNVNCVNTPYPIIGIIYLFADNWAIFSTDDVDSEIGLFTESTCTYKIITNDKCLNFNRANLITGVSKQNQDCSWHIYWADGNRNPDRTLNIDNVPYKQNCVITAGCLVCTPILPLQLDCDKLRIAKLVDIPCIQIEKGASGGNLLNGSYVATMAYVVNGQKVTDYLALSNTQAIFEHNNVAGSVDVLLTGLDTRFDEFELVVISIVNQQTQAKKFGIYNTRQSRITIDIIDNKLVNIPLEFIPIYTPIVDSSDAIFEVGNYMLRVGPTDKFDFNYQPLANQIVTKWASVEYPSDYYRKGGNNPSFLRDEQAALFIRWVYNDGDRSSSYHIPGRAPTPADLAIIAGADAQIEISEGLTPFAWRVLNTASVTSIATTVLPDGGIEIAEGLMGYWESTELYPDDKPAVYGALCGLPIRHHKFPEPLLHTNVRIFTPSSPNLGGNPAIRIMGVKFENIKAPLDAAGNPITNIVGYEILKGSREGNKTIIAKGIINNMFNYTIEGGVTPRQGLYPNYPYNDLSPDVFISTTDTSYTGGSISGYNPNAGARSDMFTFHSPDTQFKNPFLSMKEIKVYGQISGQTEGQFIEPDKHPKHKLITDLTFYVSIIAGSATAFLNVNGQRTTNYTFPHREGFEDSGQFTLSGYTSGTGLFGQDNPTTIAFDAAAQAAQSVMQAANNAAYAANYPTGAQLGLNIGGGTTQPYYATLSTAANTAESLEGLTGYQKNISQTDGAYSNMPAYLSVLQAIPTFINYLSEGADAVIRLFKSVMPYQQYALQYQSHCFYNGWTNSILNNTRRLIGEMSYLDNHIQDFGANFRINNLFRNNSVAVQTTNALANPVGDNSRVTVGNMGLWSTPTTPFNRNASSHYVALKNRLLNQYGQIGGVQQIPFGCESKVTIFSNPLLNIPFISPVLFGGDTYVTRYTEKNTMFFFNDWLYDQPDGFEFNYHLKRMLPYPTYWVDTRNADIPSFLNSVVSNLFPLSTASWLIPSKQRVLDRVGPDPSTAFMVKEAYFYLFNSGVRDFYVESEVNTEFRDWGANDYERYYDPYRYTDLRTIFNSKIIKFGDTFKYDYSLSIAKTFLNFISWGNIQPINYDPAIYATCYTYYPHRVIYSLPQQLELIRDNWLIFLANNYKDFKTKVISIKPINQSGAILFFDTDSPVQFYGVDQLQTTNGVKLTIGDGGLFSQPLQNLTISEKAFEYGSCQNRYSIVNTPEGIFYISRSLGNIYQIVGNGLQEISTIENHWWFINYLQYFILEDFPDFELLDNPVIGVGCQAMYDNNYDIVYFTKRDFKLRTDITATVVYVSKDDFLVNGTLPVKLGDPAYFEDASWTMSYSTRDRAWISAHDWHPNLMIPSKNNLLSILSNGIWKHNDICDSYCNFYGVDYPFEVEYRIDTGQQVNTLRSIQYQLEVYIYDVNCHDRFLSLDENFDEAVIFNNEQVSGLLKLFITPKNDPQAALAYPIVNPASIDILFSKEESKYRFNQFWDITDDRGEFTTAQRMIWNTQSNGYIKNLNPANLNYAKDPFQHKKFRGYTTSVFLRRKVSGNKKFLIILTNNKNLQSLR